jgi:hypothetical protein
MPKIRAVRHKSSWHVQGKGIAHARVGSWETEDKGKPGKYRGDKWFEPTGTLHGWTSDGSESERHAALERSVHSEGYTTTIRKLVALKNVTTSRQTKSAANEGILYLQGKYR